MRARRQLSVAVCLALARVTTAAAQTDTFDGDQGRAPITSVEIIFVGPKSSCEPLMSAVAPILGAGDRVSQVEDGAQEGVMEARGARIVVDVATEGRVQISVSDRDRRTLVRTIDGAVSSSIKAETVAQIVRETTIALRARPDVEAVPATSPPPMVAVAPTAIAVLQREDEGRNVEPEVARPRLTLSLEYARRATIPRGVLGADAPAEKGAVGTLVFEIPRAHHLFLAVLSGWTRTSLPPIQDNLGTPGLSIDRFSARALMGLALPLPPVGLRAAAGLGADALWVRAGDTGQGTILIPTLEAIVQGLVALPLTGLVVQGTLTLDVQPKATFTESTGYPPYEFAWTSRLQPGFMVGLGWQR